MSSMMDAADMTEEQLDAAIFSNPSEHDSGSDNGSEDVSPSDDTQGQPEIEATTPDVDQEVSEVEDPESSLSTEEDDSGDESKETEVDNESTDGISEDDSETKSEADNEPIAFQPLRADGKEYPIENIQELYTLASKGINANRKWEESAEGRKLQQTMSKNNISMDDLNALIDMKGGSKEAIMNMLNKLEIDPLDMDADAFNGEYKPKDHSTGDFEIALDDVVGRIKDQPRYQETVNVIMDQWDSESKEAFYKDPNLMQLLNVDMQVNPETGFAMYDKVAPLAQKLKALDTENRSDLDYYMQAGKKVIGDLNTQKQAKADAVKQEQVKKAANKASLDKKKKAAGSSGGQLANQTAKDVSELSDEELDALLEETN